MAKQLLGNVKGQDADPLVLYPVGTVFEVKSSESDQDPAEMFGGSWTLDTETYLFRGIRRYWRTA